MRSLETITKWNQLACGIVTLVALHCHVVQANDYRNETNAIMRHSVSWKTAVKWIEERIPDGEERAAAISSLDQYPESELLPYLQKYSVDSSSRTRIAAFWPLYAHGKREDANALLEREAISGNRWCARVFPMPNASGPDRRFRLTSSDPEFKRLVKKIATSHDIDPWIRIHAAIHLTQLKESRVARQVAENILATVPAPRQSKNFSDLGKQEQQDWHTRNMAEWCVKVATGVNGY